MDLCALHRGLELADTLKHGLITHVRVPLPVSVLRCGTEGGCMNTCSEKQATVFVSELDASFLGLGFLTLQKGRNALHSEVL